MLGTISIAPHQSTLSVYSFERSSTQDLAAMQEPVLRHNAIGSLAETMGCHDVDILIDLIDTYTQDSQQIVHTMRTALESGSLTILQRAAHTLKSSSAVMGASRLSRLSEIIEHELRKDLTWPYVQINVELLFNEHHAAMQALGAERRRLSMTV